MILHINLNRLIVVLVVLILNTSCIGTKHTDGVYVINLSRLEGRDIIYATDDHFVDSYTAIKLVIDEGVIADINQMHIYEDIIYIFDKKQERIMTFGLDGIYIKDIGRKGRAENEFGAVSSFYVNPEGRTIGVVDPLKMQLIHYGINGNFIKTTRIHEKAAGPITNMRYISDGKVLCYSSPNAFDDRILFVVDDDDFSLIEVISNSPFPADAGAYVLARQPYSVVSGEVHFVSLFSNGVCSYVDGIIEKVYHLDNRKKELTEDKLKVIAAKNNFNYISTAIDISENYSYTAGIQDFFESDRFIFTTTTLKYNSIFLDKHTGRGYVMNMHSLGSPGLSDIFYSAGNTFVKVWKQDQVEAFRKKLEEDNGLRGNYDENILEIVDSYDQFEDNPVLIIFRMKE